MPLIFLLIFGNVSFCAQVSATIEPRPICGIVTTKNDPVPLKKIEITTDVYGFFADVMTNITYYNEDEVPLEVQFVFPLDANSALYDMQSHCERTIRGVVKDKEEARKEYEDAIKEGKQASILEEDDKHSDILTLKLGNIKPDQTCWVSFQFVSEMDISLEKPVSFFTYPIVLGERYHSGPGKDISSEPDRVEKVPYEWTFEFNVIEPKGVFVEPVGNLKWERNGESSASLSKGQSLGENIILKVTHSDYRPFQLVEVGQSPGNCENENNFENFLNDTVAMLNLLPDLYDKPLDRGQEFVIVVDRSGSMEAGSRMNQAKKTIFTFLKNLPSDNSKCKFNILSFGSSHNFMFPKSVQCTSSNINEANSQVHDFKADLGGTEMYFALEELFQLDISGQRQTFIITDGQVSNTRDVIDLVEKYSKSNRVFSFGIGEGVSTELVHGVAQFNGVSRILKSEEDTEALEKHVLRALKASQSTFYYDLKLDLNLNEGVCGEVTSMGNAIFPGEVFVVFVLLKGDIEGDLGKATMSAKSVNEDSKKFEFELKADRMVDVKSKPIHRIAAKRLISQMEPFDDKMVKISVASNVLSPATAIVAIDEESDPSDTPAKKVTAPVLSEESVSVVSKSADVAASAPNSAPPPPHAPSYEESSFPKMSFPAAILMMIFAIGK